MVPRLRLKWSEKMTRLQALEAVAEAARTYVKKRGMSPTWPDLIAAVQALDALPADPTPAEVVELAVWEERGTGRVLTVRVGSDIDKHYAETSLQRLGTTRLPLVKGDKS
jgi:hypothetical protein